MIWSVLHRFHHFWYGYKDRWELPEAVTTDNGPQFTSFEFAEFLRSQGIEHRFTSLYNPQSNGGVERFNRTMKERIKAFMAERKSFAKAVRKTLYNKTCSHRNISSEVDDCNFEDINVKFEICLNTTTVSGLPSMLSSWFSSLLYSLLWTASFMTCIQPCVCCRGLPDRWVAVPSLHVTFTGISLAVMENLIFRI